MSSAGKNRMSPYVSLEPASQISGNMSPAGALWDAAGRF